MSTRKRSNIVSTTSRTDLPASRKRKATSKRETTGSFYRMPFSTFIYTISALALVFITFQVWRIIQIKSAVGGWWNLVLGTQPPITGNAHGSGKGNVGEGESAEDRINALAEVLGLQPHHLASAIAEAVKSRVPQATLSSMTAAEEVTNGGPVAGIFEGEEQTQQSHMGMADNSGASSDFDNPDVLD